MTEASPTAEFHATRSHSHRMHRPAVELDLESPSGRWLLQLPAGVPVDAIVATLLPAQARLDQRRCRHELLDELEREVLTAAEVYGPLRGEIRPAQRPYSEVLDLIAAEREGGIE